MQLDLPKGGMFVENLSVQVHTDVGLHVFGAVIENFVGIQSLGHCPCADDVIHNALAKSFRYLVKLHKFPHIVQHIVILGGGGSHLLDDRGNVTEDRSV